MPLARVVTFEGIDEERMAQTARELRENDPPEGMNPTEIMVLHDREGDRAVVVVFFDDEDDYRRGDEILGALPADETPGRRASVGKYEVVVRRAR